WPSPIPINSGASSTPSWVCSKTPWPGRSTVVWCGPEMPGATRAPCSTSCCRTCTPSSVTRSRIPPPRSPRNCGRSARRRCDRDPRHARAGRHVMTDGVLLPDPAPRPIRVPVISVDDHLIEPPDMFEGRMPRHLAERAPRIVEREDGVQYWVYEDRTYPNVGLNAVAGRRRDTWSMDPSRFDEMRPGCFDIGARVADMDINGVWASLCFPSLVAGFCGSVFSRSDDL